MRSYLQNFLSGRRRLGYGGVVCSKKYSTHGGALPKEAALPAPALGRRRGKSCLFPFAFFSENAFNATFIPRRRIGFKIKIEKLQEKNQVTDRGPAGQ